MRNLYKHIVVLGSAESGVGAALLAKQKGISVFVSDIKEIKASFKQELIENNIDFEEGKHSDDILAKADCVIKSPGIPDKAPVVIEARKRGIPVINEIEFAAHYSRAKFVCITGTNGKTTTTLLTYHIFKKAGLDVGLAGNIGTSLSRALTQNDHDYFVLEISSFQLDGLYNFKADVAILLNITPDHLDRYDNELANYVYSKFRITQNQTRSSAFVYCADDELTLKNMEKKKSHARFIPFSIKKQLTTGAWLNESNEIIIQTNNQQEPFIMSIFDLALQGKHNIYNSMAAGVAARVFDIRKEIVRESLMDFENIEHRLEFVAKVHGIEFINDSKATNVNSTWYALESMNSPVIWIAGGVDKGNDYSMLYDLVKKRVKAIVCLGKDNKRIHEAFGSIVERIIDTSSAREAVKASYLIGKKGDTVLLSPACASFDLFENYEDRGRQFKAAVREL
jgi:UDP-N-acetylmuramoylalanine--D-glutamate ligase